MPWVLARDTTTKLAGKERVSLATAASTNSQKSTRSGKIRQFSSTLLCVGKLGSGKSVLLANVVDDLFSNANATATIAYFFCQHDALERMKAQTVIGSLTRQLLQPIQDLAPASDFLVKHPGRGVVHLCGLLKAMLSREYRAYIVLDGLDNCTDGERTAILDSLRKLQDMTCVSLCTLRLEASDHLRFSFESFPSLSSFCIPKHNPDIDDFIEPELERCLESGSLALHDPRLILDIQKSLSKGAQGMFLWVALQIKALCLERTDTGIRQAITNLPTDLSDTYNTILQKCGISDLSYQSKIFQLIAVACRPLTTEGMREALSVIRGEKDWNPQNRVNNIYSTLASCGRLLIIDEEDLGIRMVHHSVMAFLQTGWRGAEPFDLGHAKQTMANVVVAYLGYGRFSKTLSTLKSPGIQGTAIASAVTRAAAQSLGQSQRLALKLLRTQGRTERNIGPTLLKALGDYTNDAPSFFYQYADRWWPDHIWHLDYPNSSLRRALLKLLSMVDPNKVGSNGDTPLSHAAAYGFYEAVTYLLAYGAQYTYNSSGLTPLMRPVKGGNKSVVQAFLDTRSPQPNAKDWLGRTSLALALMAKDHPMVVTLLACNRVDPNIQDNGGRTPLMWAVDGGLLQEVHLLLETPGIDLKSDNYGNTIFHIAAQNGHLEIMNTITHETDLDINSSNSRGQTPIWLAAANGRESFVKCLVDLKGVDSDFRSNSGLSPLMVAVQKGHTKTQRPPDCGGFSQTTAPSLSFTVR
ncbi:ankyrin repeat-containing domain protein [Aspergillus germanicus]